MRPYRLADITHAEIATWLAGLVASDLPSATVRQAHQVFSLLLAIAIRDGRISRDPAVVVPLPGVRRADPGS